jgi:hypothetical protein
MPSTELNWDTGLTRHFAHRSINERWCVKMVGNASLLPTLPKITLKQLKGATPLVILIVSSNLLMIMDR